MQDLPKQDLPKIVRSRLQEAAAAEAHPDADLLTAFVERTLAKSERLRLVEHLASCGDCRDVVSLALPSLEGVEAATSARPVRRGWWSLPILRWGTVIAGIIAVTSLSIVQYRTVQYRHHQSKNETVVSSLIARNDASSAAQALQPSPQVSEPQAVLPQTEIRQPKSQKKVLPDRVSAGTASTPKRGMTAAIPERIPAQRVDRQVALPPSSHVIDVQPETAAVATQNLVPDQLAPSQFALNQKEPLLQSRSLTDSDVVKAKDPALPQAASNGARWTISSAGNLQRSFDAGKTWEEVDVDAEAVGDSLQAGDAVRNEQNEQKKVPNKSAQPSFVFRAVAAVGSEVWAGGSGATLYHSGDSGAHWTRLLPSAGAAAVTGDITAVEFSDPQHGRVATSAGEFWITDDGGQTWGPQQ